MLDADCKLFNLGNTPITTGSLFEFLIILILTYVLAKLIKSQLRRFGKRNKMVSQSGIYTLSRICFYIIAVLGLLTAFNAVGIDLSTFTVVAGALSVGIGFGLQVIFNCFVSGIILLFEKNIKVGDEVEMDGGVRGTVEEIFVRTTRIRGEAGQLLIVPNTDLVNRRLTNWSAAPKKATRARRR